MDIQEILAQLAQSSNSAAMAAQQLASTLQSTNQSAGGASASIKNFNKGVGLVTGKLNPLAATVNAVAQSLMGYMGAQIRLTKTVLDFQSQIYDTEDTLANMTTGLAESFKTMKDMVSSSAGPFLELIKAIPGIGDIAGASEKMILEGLQVIESANNQSMKVITGQTKAMQNLNGNFGVLTTDVSKFSQTAREAGMTSDQFSRMLIDNSKPLSTVFGGVHKASQRLGQELYKLHSQSNDVRDQFVALGMSPDEMTAAMVEYANMQRILTKGQQLQQGELAAQTLKYQQNLKSISAITGQNAKEMQAEREARLRNAAFMAKIDELNAAGKHAEAAALQEAVDAAAKFGPAQEALAMEIAVHGHAVSKTSHMTTMTNKALADTTKANIDATKGFTGTAEEAAKMNLEAYDAKKDEIDAGRAQMRELAKLSNLGVNSELVSAVEQTYVETRDHIDKTGNLAAEFESTMAQLRDAQTEEIKAVQGRTKIIADESQRQQEMRVRVEKDTEAVADSVLKVGSALTRVEEGLMESRRGLIQDFQEFTNKFAEGAVNATPENIYKLLKDFFTSRLDKENVAQKEEKISQAATIQMTLNPEDSAALLEYASELQKKKKTEPIGQSTDGVAFSGALGGIAVGPKTGYRALLHGTEAVVPLPDGKSIPVNFDAEQLSMAMKEGMSGMMSASGGVNNEALEALMRQSVSLNSEILKTLKQGNVTNHKLVRVMS